MTSYDWDELIRPYANSNHPELLRRDVEGDQARRGQRTGECAALAMAIKAADDQRVRTAKYEELITLIRQRQATWLKYVASHTHSEERWRYIHGFLEGGPSLSFSLIVWWPFIWLWYFVKWMLRMTVEWRLTKQCQRGRCPKCGYRLSAAQQYDSKDLVLLQTMERCPECACAWPLVPPAWP